MPRIDEISDKFFGRDESGSTLGEFVSTLIADESRNSEAGLNLTVSGEFTVNGYDVYQLLADRGTGRIFDGLKSLEAMSRVIRGVGVSSISLFDNKIIAFTPSDMKTSTPDLAFTIVNANIGMKEVHSYARTKNIPELARYNKFVSSVARTVKSGAFRAEDHLAEALLVVKALIKAAMRIEANR